MSRSARRRRSTTPGRRRSVADFIGRCNTLAGHVVDADSDSVVVDLDVGQRVRVETGTPVGPGARVTLGVRSERLGVSSRPPSAVDGGVLPARVVVRSYTGARYEYELDIEGTRLFVESDEVLSGEQAFVLVPHSGTFVFADN